MAVGKKILISLVPLVFLLTACSMQQDGRLTIIDAKTASSVDENINPVNPTDVFPAGQTRISCWIKWKDGQVNTEVLTKWHYVTDDVHIVDHALIIPKKEGAGSVELNMPEGKTFPPGQYKVDIVLGRRLLKRLTFKVT